MPARNITISAMIGALEIMCSRAGQGRTHWEREGLRRSEALVLRQIRYRLPVERAVRTCPAPRGRRVRASSCASRKVPSASSTSVAESLRTVFSPTTRCDGYSFPQFLCCVRSTHPISIYCSTITLSCTSVTPSSASLRTCASASAFGCACACASTCGCACVVPHSQVQALQPRCAGRGS